MKSGHQIFELIRGINGTNVLTKLHEDQTINVASRVFTRLNQGDARRKAELALDGVRDVAPSIYLDILKIVPEPTMTNRAPLSLMNRLKKPIELSVSQSFAHLRGTNILVNFHHY
ncbi:hypothetical protein DPMN_045144 [Dreissena polymorpha]|uniref:Uncharacterized protein n=1 Tax=Dreissena polymorpha TaxID=45954 RepID=A0A9D4D4I4_DREPO|nr:hypothetical protein DPMN_045144 [Dreissena polymorpha]